MDVTNQSNSPGLVPNEAMHPLVAYRKQNGLTQGDLASRLEVARGTIARWENGTRTPRLKEAKRVSSRTGIPIAELLTGALNAEAAQ